MHVVAVGEEFLGIAVQGGFQDRHRGPPVSMCLL
jgi:hypothetical protein